MPYPIAWLICQAKGHQPSLTLAVMFGFDHPICERCRRDCPRS